MNEDKVIILRGIPGSGKSYHVEENFTEGNSAVCSADHHFTDENGNYEFDKTLIGEAHKQCMQKFLSLAMHPGNRRGRTVIVDNTNISMYECSPYYTVAAAQGLDVLLVTLLCPPRIAWIRNKHGLEAADVYRMSRRLDEQSNYIPSFWNHEVLFFSSWP